MKKHIEFKEFYSAESTINAINNTAKYGLENLKRVHDARSVGFLITQPLKIIINIPEAIAVYRYTEPITDVPSS